MKNLRFIALTGFMACCMLLLGSQSSSFAQGKSGKSRGNSNIGKSRSTDVIRRGIERMTTNRARNVRNSDRDWNDYRSSGKSKNKRKASHSNNGVRDYGRGIGRGKGQGKGRGYDKRRSKSRNH